MSIVNISVQQLFNGDKNLQNQTVSIENGVISNIENCVDGVECLPGILVPGFIDVQVNGGGGYLFNETPTLLAIEAIGKAHQKFGTTGWLPTLVTDSDLKMRQAANAVAEAREKNTAGIYGIHFEGPHLSVAKKGVHSAEFIREISDNEMMIFKRQDLGKVVVTVAPEKISPDQIEELVASGVIVCLGHSNATFDQTIEALNSGASGFTHLFNAMSAFTSRQPGMVGAALLDDKSFAGLILDGIHVHPQSARLAFKIKSNIMLVTDAMPPVGTNKNQFEFFGQLIRRNGNKLTDKNGRLAGSVLDMVTAVKNAVSMLDIELTTAVNLASKNPAKFLGLDNEYGTLKTGCKASMLLLNINGCIRSSWIDGIKIL